MSTTAKDLKVGATAEKDVHLKMQGGYGQEFLVPGEPDAGQPGVILVQKGDEISYGMVKKLEAAQENAARLGKASKKAENAGGRAPAKKAAAKKAPAAGKPDPSAGIGVKTAE